MSQNPSLIVYDGLLPPAIRNLAETSLHLIVVYADMEGRILAINQPFSKLVAESSEQLRGKILFDFIMTTTPQAELDEIRRLKPDQFSESDRKHMGGPQSVPISFYRRYWKLEEGFILIAEPDINSHKFFENHMLSVNNDLSDLIRLQAKEKSFLEREMILANQLQSASAKVNAVITNAMDGIITIDDHGIIESFNPAAERIFACKADEMVGKNINLLMPEPYRTEHDSYINKYLHTLQSKVIGITRELPALRKNGEIFSAEISFSEILLTNQRLFTGIVRDITERKQNEMELQQYRKHLEDLVAQRTTALTKAHSQLLHSEKLSSLGKLTGSIAHEFNNPLYGVSNLVEQTLEHLEHDEEFKPLLTLALKECNRMADMIRRLQSFYKPSPEVFLPLNIHEILDDICLLMKKKLQVRKITLEKQYCANLPQIIAVEDQLKQVILNLLSNAEEAIPEPKGGIPEVVGKIILTTQVDSTNVIISIQDTGEGIPQENLSTVFEPFFTTKAIKGTGLGLYVCHGIVKAHGGQIEVNSELGKGTTFTLTLPIKREQI